MYRALYVKSVLKDAVGRGFDTGLGAAIFRSVLRRCDTCIERGMKQLGWGKKRVFLLKAIILPACKIFQTNAIKIINLTTKRM
jgi:hypothetical protein